MKKRIGALLLALLLTVSAVCGMAAPAYADTEPAGYVVMSVEKLTLGQGFIAEPQKVAFYKGETLAQVLDRLLTAENREYLHTGALTSGFYLSDIQDADRGIVTIPSYIYAMLPAGKTISPQDSSPAYLGEYDYYHQSGWMYSLNNAFPDVGAGNVAAQDGMVVRWQFTLVGYGGDLGNSNPSAQSPRTFMDRTKLYTVLASLRGSEALKVGGRKECYDDLLEKSTDITWEMSSEDIDELNTLVAALGGNKVTDIQLPTHESGVKTVAYGTTQDAATADFPTYLRATVDGKSQILTGITEWRLDYEFGAPGAYRFYPVLPEKYSSFTVLNGVYPAMTVVVEPPSGDINGDGLLDVRDVSRLADLLGQTGTPLCDIDGSGVVAWNDLRLLAAELGSNALTVPQDAPVLTAIPSTTGTAKVTVPVGTEYDTVLVSAPEGVTLSSVTDLLTAADSGRALCAVSMDGAAAEDITLTYTGTVGESEEIQVVLLRSGRYVTTAASTYAALVSLPVGILHGDVNVDGAVDISDAMLLAKYYSGVRELTDRQLAAADVNGDGAVDVLDVTLLIEYCNGLIDRLPIDE